MFAKTDNSMKRTEKISYCNLYGNLSERLCPKSANNDDDWDELVDPCDHCCHRKSVEIEMSTFTATCIKDREGYYKAGDVVECYVNCDYLVAAGRFITIPEFKEYFEI